MTMNPALIRSCAVLIILLSQRLNCRAQTDAPLPSGVNAVWDLQKAFREKSTTREKVCLNGLWRWQPARNAAGVATLANPLTGPNTVPADGWGYFKVPGSWTADSQTMYPHPSWSNDKLNFLSTAWYQREFTIPQDWTGRRVFISAQYLNSLATIYVDGKELTVDGKGVGNIYFPGGEVDITSLCREGGKHILTVLVFALPMEGVKVSYADSAAPKEATAAPALAHRGFCGDVYLIGTPMGERLGDVKVCTSFRNGEITVDSSLRDLKADAHYTLRARVLDGGKLVKEFTGKPFAGGDLKDGRLSVAEKWKAEKLWDTHTPQNMYQLELSLIDEGGKELDVALPVRFGYREMWIDGRDFYLNGTRIFLSGTGMECASGGPERATYAAARETMARMKSFGLNFAYTGNFGCPPGAHLGFEEILTAADDAGMLLSFSVPHMGSYEDDWTKPETNDVKSSYARHAEFYVRMAQNHPSVVCYSMNHNAGGYDEDMDPDQIDGKYERKATYAVNAGKKLTRAENVVKHFDPTRIVYHHGGGNMNAMHTSNFYPNFTPIQELSDWFEHWATTGIKPVYTNEYGGPFSWDWTMYRGFHWNERTFGSAVCPWEFSMAEWNSQFLGDRAFKISDHEKENLRWEGKKLKELETRIVAKTVEVTLKDDKKVSGSLISDSKSELRLKVNLETVNVKKSDIKATNKVSGWHRWDYPYPPGSIKLDEQVAIQALYFTDNFRAYRTWGVSGISPWEYHMFWKLRDGVVASRKDFKVDWENLQRPGFSPDYTDGRPDTFPLSCERSDWIDTPAADALHRNNMPLLAYIGGKAPHFTSKDHNFVPGEAVEKQLIIINNSRETVSCDCTWNLALPQAVSGKKTVSVKTGEQERIPIHIDLPADIAAGGYALTAAVRFGNGETQNDSFAIHIMAPPQTPKTSEKIALFDPKGETAAWLKNAGVNCQAVDAAANLSSYDTLIVGKAALSLDGPAPDISRVRDGLKVILFEQTTEVLEKRFGFRVVEYGLRNVYARVPDHALLAGLSAENLRDWRGEATILPAQLKAPLSDKYSGLPSVKWCDLVVPKIWRCGCRGNVASVLIEKPACGDFLPIVDGGFSLQYSPLMEYREGKGLILFCQMDVSGRTESDPAAATLAGNILRYAFGWKPSPARKALYVGDAAGKAHLEKTGVSVELYEGGKLSADQVLITGPGAGQKLAASAADIAEWLKAGGNLLALGLHETDANAFLPFKVSMKNAEHIASYFEPPSVKSALAGVGPADVHNHTPLDLPLVTGGAAIIGDGVLGKAENVNVVFCQTVPWQYTYISPHYLKRTFRRSSCVVSRLLANMGVSEATPILDRFHTPVDASKPEKRWLDGLYLDQPEEWDVPYRFFRW